MLSSFGWILKLSKVPELIVYADDDVYLHHDRISNLLTDGSTDKPMVMCGDQLRRWERPTRDTSVKW